MPDNQLMPIAVEARDVAPLPLPAYPLAFAARLSGRTKRPLGDLFGLSHIGINLTSIAPGRQSSLHHRHSHQEEFVFVIEGMPTLVTDDGEVELRPGMCAGFRLGGPAHHLENRGEKPAVILEFGDRPIVDAVDYPSDDLQIDFHPDGSCSFRNKRGDPY